MTGRASAQLVWSELCLNRKNWLVLLIGSITELVVTPETGVQGPVETLPEDSRT